MNKPSNKNEKDNDDIINNNKSDNGNNTYVLKTRSIILANENFFQRRSSLFQMVQNYQYQNKIKIPKSFLYSKNGNLFKV